MWNFSDPPRCCPRDAKKSTNAPLVERFHKPTSPNTMPRKSMPTTALLRECQAARVAANKEQREAEAPVRAARRKLDARLRSAVRSVDRYNLEVSHQLFEKGSGCLLFNSYRLEQAERALAEASALFKSRLTDLMLFDAANRVEGADYPRLPVLDRQATIAAGKADHQRRMAEVRAMMERDGYLPRGTTNEL